MSDLRASGAAVLENPARYGYWLARYGGSMDHCRPMLDWLEANVGARDQRWRWITIRQFAFVCQDDALQFALTWG